MSRRLLIYVQHLLGIGHLARTARIAAAAAEAGLTVRVISGGEPVPSLSFGGAEIVQFHRCAPPIPHSLAWSIAQEFRSMTGQR